ncbi:MAG: hypothetical protein ABGY96_28995 [bacterium]|nr:hypothetical protein [Gammaproteobacteria bacterium]
MNFKKHIWLVGLVIFTFTSCVSTSDNYDQENVDLIIIDAKIFTSNNDQPWAEADYSLPESCPPDSFNAKILIKILWQS